MRSRDRKLGISCSIENLKSVGYTISGSYSKIELYVNGTIVDVNDCKTNVCSYTYNETTIDNCSISITNEGVESEILYVLDQHPNDLDAISLYLSSLTLGRCAMIGLMLVVLDCIIAIVFRYEKPDTRSELAITIMAVFILGIIIESDGSNILKFISSSGTLIILASSTTLSVGVKFILST